MSTHRSGLIARLIFAFCVIAHIAIAPLMLSSNQSWDPFGLLLLGFPLVGAVIASRQRGNRIGWILLAGGASVTTGLLFAAIVYATITGHSTYWQQILAALTNIAFIGGFEGTLLAMAFLFPTGRALSRRWRNIGIVSAGASVLAFLMAMAMPGNVGGYFGESIDIRNPFGVEGFDAYTSLYEVVAIALSAFVFLASLAAVITRVRQARGIERLQIKWLALALGLVSLFGVLSMLVGRLTSTGVIWEATGALFFLSGTVGMPIAIGIAILRYQLYDIERLISRTLSYALLSALLIGVYLLMALGLGSLMQTITGGSSNVVVAASTLLAAALFRPLRSRIQQIVDRRFYRRNYDAARTIEDFSSRIRDQLDLPSLSAELQTVTMQTMQPQHMSVWIRTSSKTERRE